MVHGANDPPHAFEGSDWWTESMEALDPSGPVLASDDRLPRKPEGLLLGGPTWMLDLLSVGLGLAVGAGAMWAVRFRRANATPTTDRFQLTTGWRVGEFRDPVLVVRDLVDVPVPDGVRVMASGLVDADVQARCEVRQVPPVRAEFILDEAAGRALLFPGGARAGTLGLLTSEPSVLERLAAEVRSLWDKGEPYVERYRIGELGHRTGVFVETEGDVQDVLSWHDQWMVRLEDQGHVLGVLVPKDPSALTGSRIRVQGRLGRDDNGYVVLHAKDIRRVA